MKVSVIIPVYNVEPYIGQCLESVRNQTLKEIEIICVNDCGQDGSWDIVRREAADDGRIVTVDADRNTGVAAARNRGLSAARGQYVYFLDADDMIRENTLAELYAGTENENLDVQVFEAEFIYETEALREKFHTNPSGFKNDYPDVMNGRELFLRWMEAWDWISPQPRFFYRRSFLERNGLKFIDGMLHEDEPFVLDVLMCAERVRVMHRPYHFRRFRPGSIMTVTPAGKNYEGCIIILRHALSILREHDGDRELEQALSFYMTKIAADARRKYREALAAGDETIIPEISVVIPVYNVEQYLEECLESVLSQDVLNIEVICVDDCSTDRSAAILQRYEMLDPRVRVTENSRNRGQSYGRNTGLSQACGTYVYMLDADDRLVPGAFRELRQLCLAENPDVVGFENRQFTDDPHFRERAAEVLFSYAGADGVYTGGEAFYACVTGDCLSPSVPTFLLRRGYIESRNLRFTEGILHEDIGFILEMLLFAGKVVLLDRPYFLRRFRTGSTVTRAMAARNIEGYLKSCMRSYELEQDLKDRFAETSPVWPAVRKWRRDVLGRIRQLYLSNETAIYREAGGSVDEEIRRIFDLFKIAVPGKARAAEILGSDVYREIAEKCSGSGTPGIYVCGHGQYMYRALELYGAAGLVIRGIIDPSGTADALRGFRVCRPEEVTDKDTPVVLSVSRYQQDRYRACLQENGFQHIVSMRF